MYKLTLIVVALLSVSCAKKAKQINLNEIKAKIIKAEDDFKNLSQSKGIGVAFYTFADDDAVIKRENDTLIKGKENIKSYYRNPKFKNASVTWKPDFVDVSNDGTIAYTYGNYIWTVKDSLGNERNFKGIFHTVWKKQKNGSWKYVWD